MKKLKKQYENIVNKYVKEFERISGSDFDGWTGEVGEMGSFNDLYLDFYDIKRVVDGNIKFNIFEDWYYFNLESAKLIVNLKSYVGLRRTYENHKEFNSIEFHGYFLQGNRNFNEYFNL